MKINSDAKERFPKRASRKKVEPKKAKVVVAKVEKKAPQAEQPDGETLEGLSGIGKKIIQALKEAGFETLSKIASSHTEDLTQVKGLGKVKAQRMIEEAKKLTKDK